MKNQLILCDFFGVICSEVAPRWFSAYFEPQEAVELKDKYFEKVDLGLISMEDTMKQIAQDYNLDAQQLAADWAKLFERQDAMIERLRQLKKDYHLVLVSNAGTGVVEKVMDDFDINDIFEKRFISANHAMKKPDLAFYRLAIESFTEKFDKIYMIDDNISNLTHLPEIGVTPILYRDVQDVAFL